MVNTLHNPAVYNILHEEAIKIRPSKFGSVGTLFSGEGVEAVWVKKQNEEIEPGWFSQPVVDLILVVQGKLKVEFESQELAPLLLEPGELIVLPAGVKCRAYRWPRDTKEATIFLAVYPARGEA